VYQTYHSLKHGGKKKQHGGQNRYHRSSPTNGTGWEKGKGKKKNGGTREGNALKKKTRKSKKGDPPPYAKGTGPAPPVGKKKRGRNAKVIIETAKLSKRGEKHQKEGHSPGRRAEDDA